MTHKLWVIKFFPENNIKVFIFLCLKFFKYLTKIVAAHCCEWSSRIEVKVASYDQDPWDMSTGEFNVFSSRIIVHPDYRGGSSLGEAWGSGNDICLLEVPNLTDAQYDEWGPMSGPPSWSPVCLPSAHAEPGQFCYVAGWGTTSYGGSASTTVQIVPTIENLLSLES